MDSNLNFGGFITMESYKRLRLSAGLFETLMLFGKNPEKELTAVEIIRAKKIPKSTVYYWLTTLEYRGYLQSRIEIHEGGQRKFYFITEFGMNSYREYQERVFGMPLAAKL
jgi:DNA-binding MarR family transcriptional regulator